MHKLKFLLIGLSLVCTQALASWTPTTWTDTYNPSPDIKLDFPQSLTHTFDITDGLGGYRPGTDAISTYALSINLYDDKDLTRFTPEWAFVDMPGVLGDITFFDVSGEEFGGWSLLGSLDLSLTGHITMTISSLLGDFYFGDATLTASGARWVTPAQDNNVPEPGSLALVGLALAGLGFGRRSKAAR